MSDEFKSGVAFLAHAAHVPIVPCYIDGTEAAWPRGGRRFKPAKIRVFLDAPVTIADSASEKEGHYERSTERVMERIRFLKSLADGQKKGNNTECPTQQ